MNFWPNRAPLTHRGSVSTRLVYIVTLLFFSLLLSVSYGAVASPDLRQVALSDKFLIWSSWEGAVDAATVHVGAYDWLLRGGADAASIIDEAVAVEVAAKDIDTVTATLSADTIDPKNDTNIPDSNSSSPVSEDEGSSSKSKYSLFQVGDGSTEDPDGIPLRYLNMQKGHREHAAKALAATQQWRKEHDIDTLLLRPQTKYDICKAVFPHYFIGRDFEGHVIFLQRPALLDLDKAHKNNLTHDELLMHYVYVNEYLWQILEADSPLGTMTSVIDVTGVHLGIMKQTELVSFVKQFVSTMDAHFPQRAHKTLILNAPKWFHVLYKIMSPLLRETTKAKIEIHSRGKKQDEALIKLMGEKAKEVFPPNLWKKKRKGKRKKVEDEDEEDDEVDEEALATDTASKVSDLEQQLRSYTLAQIHQAGQAMQAVV